jgi:vacuolar-type H+-ATPase subunit E/Vma4
LGLADLRASVEQRARDEIAALQREATERAEHLLAEARAERARRREARLEDERRALRRELAGRRSEARRAARARVLRSREACLDAVFARARSAVEADPALLPEAGEIAARVEAALAALPPGPAVFTCSPGVAEAVEAALRDRDDARVEVAPDASPGFLARGAEGRLEVDARWEALLEQRREELAIELLHRLAEGEER